MGSVLVKVAPDDPRYLVWSSVVDDVTWIFDNEAEARSYLVSLHPQIDIENARDWVDQQVDEALARTNETGCSGRTQFSSEFRFDASPDDLIMYHQDGFFHRSSLGVLFSIIEGATEDEWREGVVLKRLKAAADFKPMERG